VSDIMEQKGMRPMSMMTSDTLQEAAPFEARFVRLNRRPRRLWAALGAAAMLMAASHVSLALQSPAQSIKTALGNAATEMTAPAGPLPTAAALEAVRRHFAGQPATIDAQHWPQLAVTVARVDRTSCIEAATIASRMEGLVVVELDNFRSAADCGESNDMTWWILP
jgi:hypothetical protein